MLVSYNKDKLLSKTVSLSQQPLGLHASFEPFTLLQTTVINTDSQIILTSQIYQLDYLTCVTGHHLNTNTLGLFCLLPTEHNRNTCSDLITS